MFAPGKHPNLLAALATSAELAKSFYIKALLLYTTDGANEGFPNLPKIHEENKLAYGQANATRPAAIALYEKWMRVFSYAHDDFWCQDDRYTPDSLGFWAKTPPGSDSGAADSSRAVEVRDGAAEERVAGVHADGGSGDAAALRPVLQQIAAGAADEVGEAAG